jgi:DNA-binding beta-propeller fold protein YncE
VTLAVTPDGKTLYVTTEIRHIARLIPVSTATNRPGPAIPVPAPAFQIVITPDSKTVYLAGSAGNAFITPVSTATNQPGKPIRIAPSVFMAMTPDGKTLYAMAPGKVVPISTATNQPGKPIRFRFAEPEPQYIIVAP